MPTYPVCRNCIYVFPDKFWKSSNPKAWEFAKCTHPKSGRNQGSTEYDYSTGTTKVKSRDIDYCSTMRKDASWAKCGSTAKLFVQREPASAELKAKRRAACIKRMKAWGIWNVAGWRIWRREWWFGAS